MKFILIVLFILEIFCAILGHASTETNNKAANVLNDEEPRQPKLVEDIDFNDYIDINDHTTVLLELNESSKKFPVENDDVEYEYYYVYEDDPNPIAQEEANSGALTPTNKTERDADHFVNNHGWTPSFTDTIPHAPQLNDGYGVPLEPPHTHHTSAAPVASPPQTHYSPVPVASPPAPQQVFIVHDYHSPQHGYHAPNHNHHHDHNHHHGHFPSSSSPRNYFPAPDIPNLLKDEEATTLISLLKQVDLVDALKGEGPFTVFAPTNEAFSKLDPNLITDAVFEKDQEAKNGIVHFIDEVIYPIPAGSLLEVLGEDDRFRVLTEAVEVANLTQLLNSTEESLTIFAPTDDAFDQLPRQAVDELFNDPNALVDLLTKHVVKSTLLSPSLTFKELETAGGQNINVKVRRGRVFIEDARLIDGDIFATNGVIQVIDRVLL